MRRLLPMLIVVLLATNGGLVLAAFDLFKKNRALRLDPSEKSVYADAPAPTGGRRVVFFGDSRAGAWPALEIPGTTFVNRGIGGQTTEQVIGRFDTDVAPLHPDVLVVQVGVNDLKEIGLFPGEKARIVARCGANVRAIVARAEAIGAYVIVSTVFSIGDVPLWRRSYIDGDDVSRAIAQVNTEIRSLASNRVAVLESAGALDGPDGRLRPEVQYDYLHLNRDGYRALEPALRAALDAARVEPAPPAE